MAKNKYFFFFIYHSVLSHPNTDDTIVFGSQIPVGHYDFETLSLRILNTFCPMIP